MKIHENKNLEVSHPGTLIAFMWGEGENRMTFLIRILIFTGLIFGIQNSFANSKRQRSTAQHKLDFKKGAWLKGENTVIEVNGIRVHDPSQCKVFDVSVAEVLQFKIECGGQEKAEKLNLKSNSRYSISRHGEHMTITKYNYLLKKPQVSMLEQASLKIPFVEEIVHIKRQSDGELAFYIEKFRVDEFGRIVQEFFMQAYGLSKKNMKISANK